MIMAWTNDEKQLLIEKYEFMTDKELIKLLNKTPGAITWNERTFRIKFEIKCFY